MTRGDGSLTAVEHQSIFSEKILPQSGLGNKTSLDYPRAILLAGQPGAGKGGLVRAASTELKRDVVTIDPDALRDFHPDVKSFRQLPRMEITSPGESLVRATARESAGVSHARKPVLFSRPGGRGCFRKTFSAVQRPCAKNRSVNNPLLATCRGC